MMNSRHGWLGKQQANLSSSPQKLVLRQLHRHALFTNREQYLRLHAISVLASNKVDSQNRINASFSRDRLGSPLPDIWDANSVYFDGLAGDNLVISLRLVLPSKNGLPIDRHFNAETEGISGTCAEISHFTVLPCFRRKIAVYDWQSVKDYARQAGCRHLIVESLMSLERFYRRLGFFRCGNPFLDPTIGVPGSSTAVNAIPMLMTL